jgi:hypothetical protein
MTGALLQKSRASFAAPDDMHLQTPVGSLPFQHLADRARDLGTGARLKPDFGHAISVFL